MDRSGRGGVSLSQKDRGGIRDSATADWNGSFYNGVRYSQTGHNGREPILVGQASCLSHQSFPTVIGDFGNEIG